MTNAFGFGTVIHKRKNFLAAGGGAAKSIILRFPRRLELSMRFSIEVIPKLSKIGPSSALIANEPNAGFLSLAVGFCRSEPLRDQSADRTCQPFGKPQRRFALGQE